MLDVKMTDVKLTDQFTRHEIAGHEIEGPVCGACYDVSNESNALTHQLERIWRPLHDLSRLWTLHNTCEI